MPQRSFLTLLLYESYRQLILAIEEPGCYGDVRDIDDGAGEIVLRDWFEWKSFDEVR